MLPPVLGKDRFHGNGNANLVYRLHDLQNIPRAVADGVSSICMNGLLRSGKKQEARSPTESKLRFFSSRRHKPVIVTTMIAGALMLVLVIAGLIAAILLITQEKNRTQDALLEAKDNFERAEQNCQRAETNFQNALNAVDRMLTPLSAEQLAGAPQMEPVRRKILHDALQFLEKFQRENNADPGGRPQMAQAYARLASVNAALGHSEQSEKAYRQALDLFAQLHSENPETVKYRYWLASCTGNFAELLRSDPGRYEEAESLFRQALIHWKNLIADFPQEADYRTNLAQTLQGLGYLLWTTDRFKEAEESYRVALDGYEQLANDYPSQAKYRMGQGWIHNSIGVLLETTGRPRDAEQSFRRALDLLDSKEEGAQGERNRSLAHLGMLLALNGCFEEAEKVQRQQMKNAENATIRNPIGLALLYRHLAVLLGATGRSGEAEEHFHKAIDLQTKLLTQSPNECRLPI
jgi:tetratricopeptide (TPR) repeat protein